MRRNEAHKMEYFQDLKGQNQNLHNYTVFSLNSKNKFSEFICDQQILTLYCYSITDVKSELLTMAKINEQIPWISYLDVLIIQSIQVL